MVENFAKWPSERGQPAKVRSSEDCEGYGVPMTVDQWYDFNEFRMSSGKCQLRETFKVQIGFDPMVNSRVLAA